MVDILEDLSDGESDLPLHQITINEHYAQAYAAKKEREEQSKCVLGLQMCNYTCV